MTSIVGDKDAEALARILKVIAHPIRLRILFILLTQSLCVNDIKAALCVTQSRVSQHLGKLRDKEILQSKRKNNKVIYGLSADPGILGLVSSLRNVIICHPSRSVQDFVKPNIVRPLQNQGAQKIVNNAA